MDTLTYIMVMMVSNVGIQEAVPLTVDSYRIFIQVNVSSRLHFHLKKKNERLTILSQFVSSQNWLEV